MSRSPFRRVALIALAAPLALGLAACSKEEGTAGSLSGEPIATIAPPAGKAWAEVVTKTPEGGYRMGNPEAPIKLIEYGSLTCSHCAEFAHEAMAELRDSFVASGRVSFEMRNFVRDGIFAARGLSKDQAAACLANPADAQAMAKNAQEQGEQLQITGTPTFLINGTKETANTWAEIKAKLQTLGAR